MTSPLSKRATVVSVIVPCYNHGAFLADAVSSILSQDYPDVDLIVVDDGSTDKTSAVAASFGPRVRYVFQPNAGLSAARNAGIAAARGDVLVFLDADDMLAEGWLSALAQKVATEAGPIVVHGGWSYVDATGSHVKSIASRPVVGDARRAFVQGNRFPVCVAGVSRSVFGLVGAFRCDLNACEDWDFWIRAAFAGTSFHALDARAALYRRHHGTISTDHARMWVAGRKVLADVVRDFGSEYAADVAVGVENWRAFCLRRLRESCRGASAMKSVMFVAKATLRDPMLAKHVIALMARRAWR